MWFDNYGRELLSANSSPVPVSGGDMLVASLLIADEKNAPPPSLPATAQFLILVFKIVIILWSFLLSKSLPIIQVDDDDDSKEICIRRKLREEEEEELTTAA